MKKALFLRILPRSQGVCKSVKLKLPWKTVRKSIKTCSELTSYSNWLLYKWQAFHIVSSWKGGELFLQGELILSYF